MHPRLAELFEYMDAERRGLRETLDAIPEQARDVRPADDRWSVRDIVEHLLIVERRVSVVVANAIAEAKEAGLEAEGDDSPILSDSLRAKYRDRSRKISASPRAHPTGGDDVETLWSALEDSRAALKSAALSGDGLALGTVSQPHPVFGPLSVYEWLELMGGHEARHADQIREVAAQLRARSPETPA